MKNPEKTKIIVSPKGSISDEKLNERIQSIKASFDAELAIIDDIKQKKIQAIAMFAVLDSMVQEESDYVRQNNSALGEYILCHSKTFAYLCKPEPITFLYHVISKLSKALENDYIEEHTQDIFNLLGYDWEHMSFAQVVNGQCIQNISIWATQMGMSEKDLSELMDKHKLSNLIVQMRNKAMHEMTGLGMSYDDDSDKTEPYYKESTRLYAKGIEYAYKDEVVSLIIPNRFLRTILIDCIDGYLEDCRAQRRTPFSNNKMTRNHVLTWYND